MNDQTKKPNKSYTSEFKESAVKLANETDQPVVMNTFMMK